MITDLGATRNLAVRRDRGSRAPTPAHLPIFSAPDPAAADQLASIHTTVARKPISPTTEVGEFTEWLAAMPSKTARA